MAGAIVGTEAQLGLGVIANCGSVVDYHAKVHDIGHLGVNACTAGGAILGRKAWMQEGMHLGMVPTSWDSDGALEFDS